MPGMDRTGPRGQGPMTGRGLGPCGGGTRQGFGRGMGRDRGFGRGLAPAQSAPVELSKEEKLKILEADKTDIEAELKEVDKLIEETNKQ